MVLRASLIVSLRVSLIVGVLVCSTRAGWANGSADSADDLIHQGVELRRHGDDRGALAVFNKAYQLDPTPRAAAQLGLAEQSLSHWVAAEAHLRQALVSGADPWIQKNRKALDESLRVVQGHLAQLEVKGTPAGAEVFVGGEDVGALPLHDPVRVATGSVDVELRAAGYATGGKRVVVPVGGYERVFVELQRQPTATPPPPAAVAAPAETPTTTIATAPVAPEEMTPRSGLRPALKWIAWGVGAVGLGVGLYGAAENGARTDTFNDAGCRLQDGVAVSVATRAYDAHCNDLKNSYESATSIAVVGLITGGVLAAAGAVLWLTEPSDRGKAAAVASRCAPTIGVDAELGATCTFRF